VTAEQRILVAYATKHGSTREVAETIAHALLEQGCEAEIRTAADDRERALLWKGRKSAFAAMGRVANDYYVQDGVVPRTKLPEVLRRDQAGEPPLRRDSGPTRAARAAGAADPSTGRAKP